MMPVFPFNNPRMPIAPIGMPVGSVVAFAGQIETDLKAPREAFKTKVEKWGWLVCAGNLVYARDFPYLYDVLGDLYATSTDDLTLEGSDKQFRLPNFQGYFLRMVDPNGEVDPDNSERKHVDGSSGDGVGTIQKCAVQTHEHIYNEPTGAVPGKDTGAFAAVKQSLTTGGPTDSLPNPPGNVKVSQKETRSVNMAVYYIIKAAAG